MSFSLIKVSFSLINIGFGNMAAAARVMAIISPESAPVKRMIQDSRDKGELIVQPMEEKHVLF